MNLQKEQSTFLDQYKQRPDLNHHLSFIDSYQKLMLNSNLFEAAVVLGSFAKGNPDRLSDIDLVVFTAETNFEKAGDLLFSHLVFPEIHAFEKRQSNCARLRKVLFENCVSAEVHLFSLNFRFQLRHPFIVLKDSIFLPSLIIDGEPPAHQSFPALSHGIDGLGWELWSLVKWWQRGQKDYVKNHLRKLIDRLEKDNSMEANAKQT